MEARELIHGGYPYAAEKRHAAADAKTAAAADHFMVEDLLDFSNDDGTFDVITGGCSAESSTVTAVDSCNSSFSGPEPHFAGDFEFSGDLCVQHEDLAELEWLSNFVEESFSSEDFQKLQLISSVKTRPADEGSELLEFQPEKVPEQTPIFRPELPVPGKARSKRSRAAPCNWTSRLLVLSPTSSAAAVNGAPSATSAFVPPTAASIPPTGGKKPIKAMQRKEARPDKDPGGGGDGRKCLHCATDKTPQWRTGPMGPKTLCNACGVRYKSGRLVPEYRPAASPTFVLTKHSNSHRKVLELRRQKEAVRSTHPHHQQFLHQGMIFDVSNGDDYLIHQHVGPDFRQLI